MITVWILYIWILAADGTLELVSSDSYSTSEICNQASKEIKFELDVSWIAQCRAEWQ